MASEPNTRKSAIASSASGIFIVPPGGKEVNRDTTGKRVDYYNVGDKIIIEVLDSAIPEALYFVNVKEKSVRIRKRRTVLTVVNLLGNYIRFKNFGTDIAKVKVTVILRHSRG